MERLFEIDDLRFFGYLDSNDNLVVIGEIIAYSELTEPFYLVCTLLDKDGDILYVAENESYGSGLVTSMIKPVSFFCGYPFILYIMPPMGGMI